MVWSAEIPMHVAVAPGVYTWQRGIREIPEELSAAIEATLVVRVCYVQCLMTKKISDGVAPHNVVLEPHALARIHCPIRNPNLGMQNASFAIPREGYNSC